MLRTAFSPRFRLLCASLSFAGAMAGLVLTPLASNVEGRPDESYPEMYFAAYGGPPAILLVIAGAIVAWVGGRDRGGSLRPRLRWLWGASASPRLWRRS